MITFWMAEPGGGFLFSVLRDAFLHAFRLPNSISPDSHYFPFCLPANFHVIGLASAELSDWQALINNARIGLDWLVLKFQ